MILTPGREAICSFARSAPAWWAYLSGGSRELEGNRGKETKKGVRSVQRECAGAAFATNWVSRIETKGTRYDQARTFGRNSNRPLLCLDMDDSEVYREFESFLVPISAFAINWAPPIKTKGTRLQTNRRPFCFDVDDSEA